MQSTSNAYTADFLYFCVFRNKLIGRELIRPRPLKIFTVGVLQRSCRYWTSGSISVIPSTLKRKSTSRTKNRIMSAKITGLYSRTLTSLSYRRSYSTMFSVSEDGQDDTPTVGAKHIRWQACCIVPIAAAKCMFTELITANEYRSLPVHSTAKYLAERFARPSTA